MSILDRSWTRPRPTRAQLATDVVLGVVAALVSVASVQVYASASGVSTGWKGVEAYLWFGLGGLALCWRRQYPLTVLVVVSAVFIVVGERLLELGAVFTIQMVLFAALYAAWAWSRRPRSLMVVTLVVLVGMFGWLLWSFGRDLMPPLGEQTGLLPPKVALIVYSVALNVMYFFGAIAWGQAAYLSARRSALVEDQRERERAVQDVEQRQAVQAELAGLGPEDDITRQAAGNLAKKAGLQGLAHGRVRQVVAAGAVEFDSHLTWRQAFIAGGDRLVAAADETGRHVTDPPEREAACEKDKENLHNGRLYAAS